MAFLLWALLTLLVVFAAVAVAVALVRRQEVAADAERAPVLQVLADELAEIDRQVANGAMTVAEADDMKADTRRRILSESREVFRAPKHLPPGQARGMAVGFAAAIVVSAAAIYGWMGRPDLALQPAPAAPVAADQQVANADLATLTQKLEARLEQTPDDPEGWRLLGGSHFSLGNFDRAVLAFQRAVALRPEDVETVSALGEAQVQAASGTVTPASRETFRKALALDGKDIRARYFLAAGLNQDGDAVGAVAAWVSLLRDAPADAPWAVELRQLVAQRAKEAGIALPAQFASASPAAPPGPDAAQVAAVQAMPPADQQAMIRAMVDGLEARLQATPNDPEGWKRLIRARMVLGEPERAQSALDSATAALPAAAAELRAFAKENAVPTQ